MNFKAGCSLAGAFTRYAVKKPPRAMYWTTSIAKCSKGSVPGISQCTSLIHQKVLKARFRHSPAARFFSPCINLYSSLPYPGQGLKKDSVKIDESKNMQRFVENRKRDQEWGRKHFPFFPDILNYFKFFLLTSSGILVAWVFYPDFIDRDSAAVDPSLENNPGIAFNLDDRTMMLRMYMGVPWRALSRAWGRFNDNIVIPVYIRPYLYRWFGRIYDVKFDEAVDPDLKNYSNLSEFFRRPIKSSVRPIDLIADVVSPSDGKILHFGKIQNGMVEQVKGVTYSLQKFLGPLHFDPVHDDWGKKDQYRHDWCKIPLENYAKALMYNPAENDLYHCVIYLAPGDYHRFHSPTDWVVQHRRHFPGDLLSVNPKIASIVPSLFVLNERVCLMGKWKHGFFSMIAVGATNVGSVDIYGDVTLKTNRPKRIYGAYYDAKYDNIPAKKGMAMGEFNLGSTIVLIFEAPKGFDFSIESNEKICYGKTLQKT